MKRVLTALMFVFVLAGVIYFIYSAIDYESDSQSYITLDEQNDKLEQFKVKGIPPFESLTIDNKTFLLTAIKSEIIILNFWASWCGPCVDEFPSLLSLVKENESKVALIAISLDTEEKQMKNFLKSYNLNLKNLFLLKDPDFTLASQFGTFKLPESYILDKDRKLIRKVSGAIDWNSSEMQSYVKSL